MPEVHGLSHALRSGGFACDGATPGRLLGALASGRMALGGLMILACSGVAAEVTRREALYGDNERCREALIPEHLIMALPAFD